MMPEDPTKATPAQQVKNPLNVMQPDERIICEIKRHPIGILAIYAGESIALIILAIFAFVIMPNLMSSDPDQAKMIGGILFLIFAIASLGFVFVATVIYWGNRWVVTSDSITQISQTGLFRKQSSQLSLGNMEDVTAEQNGMLATVLRFGLLRAETAGESSKFVFRFCPNPNYYAQKILAAREVFEKTKTGAAMAQPHTAPQQQPPAGGFSAPIGSPSQPQPTQPLQADQRPVYADRPLAPQPPAQPAPSGTPEQTDGTDSYEVPY